MRIERKLDSTLTSSNPDRGSFFLALWTTRPVVILYLVNIRSILLKIDSFFVHSLGQLKRVTIGVELVANPSILFLDEPTTGLDARSAMVIVRMLRRIARTGMGLSTDNVV